MTDKPRDKREPVGQREVVPAAITLLYESHDKQFCLFADAKGHLHAVRSELLV